jgi:formylglycine-generating enzyme required for sulfatase activity
LNEPLYPATVSDFRLDTYEITVGRFRAFVEAGKGAQGDPPLPGSGAHPAIPGSGWDAAWTAELTTDTAALKTALKCGPQWFWTDNPGPNERHPIHCVLWFEAFAFCAWDGGRLPTEAEWNYAATGGSEQRQYPWGAMIDESKASYMCLGDGSPGCSMDDFLAVGSRSPAGDGKWGHIDMAGNVGERVLDWFLQYPIPCMDCASVSSSETKRAFRGGTAWSADVLVSNDAVSADFPYNRNSSVGARCARLSAAGP